MKQMPDTPGEGGTPPRSGLRGVTPEGVSAGGNAGGEFAVDGVQRVEEGLRFRFEAEQQSGTQDAREAQVIVVHGPEPVLGAGSEVGSALDDQRGFFRDEARP